jgi:hypothetical protein
MPIRPLRLPSRVLSIVTHRKALGVTQAYVCETSGESTQDWSRWEQETWCRADTLVRIARAINAAAEAKGIATRVTIADLIAPLEPYVFDNPLTSAEGGDRAEAKK